LNRDCGALGFGKKSPAFCVVSGNSHSIVKENPSTGDEARARNGKHQEHNFGNVKTRHSLPQIPEGYRENRDYFVVGKHDLLSREIQYFAQLS
jgi:hypothetical protein